jgi:hypothetical protein
MESANERSENMHRSFVEGTNENPNFKQSQLTYEHRRRRMTSENHNPSMEYGNKSECGRLVKELN